MVKLKTKERNSNIKPIYLELFGIAWIISAILVLSNTGAMKHFEVSGTTLSLFLQCLIFFPGTVSLAWGILHSERRPDLRPVRLVAFTIAIMLASLIAYSWVYLFVNGL